MQEFHSSLFPFRRVFPCSVCSYGFAYNNGDCCGWATRILLACVSTLWTCLQCDKFDGLLSGSPIVPSCQASHRSQHAHKPMRSPTKSAEITPSFRQATPIVRIRRCDGPAVALSTREIAWPVQYPATRLCGGLGRRASRSSPKQQLLACSSASRVDVCMRYRSEA